MSKPNISMFFPAYNEEENIPIIVKSALSVLKKYANKYEVLVVVYGGSTDRSIEVTKKLAKKNKNVKLIIQPKNKKGIGAAKKIAFKAAKYPYVFYADSDNQFDLKEFKKFVPYIGKYDIIAGYRINRQDPKSRIIISKIYNLFMRSLFNVKHRDLDCAFRMISKEVLNNVNLVCKTGLATTEILAKAKKKGYKIKEIGVHHYPRLHGVPVFEVEAGPALPKPKVILDILKEVRMLRKEMRK